MQPVSTAPMKVSLQFADKLDIGNNVIAEYIWIDGSGEFRSKARTLAGISKVTSLD